MDAADLRVFEAVARLGGMSRAATDLHTVQSNVTTRVRLLEDELGRALFRRHSRGVTLTPAGERLLPYAQHMARLLSDARRAVEDDGKPCGSLVLGSMETTLARRLPPVLADYTAAWPEVDVSIRTGTTAELIDRVLAHELDGAFVCGPLRHAELEETPVFSEELVLVTAPHVRNLSTLVERGNLKIVVFRAGCSSRQRLEALLARWGVVRPHLLEFGTLDAIVGCVAAGIGVTLLPRAVVEAPAREGRVELHTLAPEASHVETVFIRRRDALVTSALTAFVRQARQGLAFPGAGGAAPSPEAIARIS